MKTTLKSKMLLALAAATAVTLFITAPSFGDDRGRDGDNRGHVIRDRDRDRGNDRDRDLDRDRNRDSGSRFNNRSGWYYQPRYASPPVVYCTPVRMVLPSRPYVVVRPPIVVIRSTPVCNSIGFWFGW